MRIYLELDAEQIAALEAVVKRSTKAYLRERASAILQIASGAFGKDVAYTGLLQRRRRNTVYDWVTRYKSQGIKGLENRPGRGRKPSFFPPEQGGVKK